MECLLIDNDVRKMSKIENYLKKINSACVVEKMYKFNDVLELDVSELEKFNFMLVDSAIDMQWGTFERKLIEKGISKPIVLITGSTKDKIKELIKKAFDRRSNIIGAIQSSVTDEQLERYFVDAVKIMEKYRKDAMVTIDDIFCFTDDRKAKIHALGHDIKNPFLALDISLQKFIRDISDIWQKAVFEDVEHALKNIPAVQKSIADLLSEIETISSLTNRNIDSIMLKDAKGGAKKPEALVTELEQLLQEATARKDLDLNVAKIIQALVRTLMNQIDYIVRATDQALYE